MVTMFVYSVFEPAPATVWAVWRLNPVMEQMSSALLNILKWATSRISKWATSRIESCENSMPWLDSALRKVLQKYFYLASRGGGKEGQFRIV